MVINPDGTVQFEGDTQKLFRGAGAATDQSVLAAQNRAARIAKYGPEQVGKMEAAGARFGGGASAAQVRTPAAPSIATATNPAPIATSAAESGTTFGQRALRALRFGGKALGAAGIGLTAGVSALKTYGTPTEDYEKRFGIGPSNLDSPTLRFARDIGVRSAGALADLGSTLNPFSSVGARAAAPTAASAVAPAAPGPSPINAEALMTGTGVPETGTGAFRVGTRPAVAVDTRSVGAPAATATAAAPSAITLPTLGTEGGIFSNLARFHSEVAAKRGAVAASGQALNRAVKLGGLEAKQAEAESRGIAAIGTLLRGQAAVASAGEVGKKVTVDMTGNPVIVDTRRNTAMAPTVRKPISEADIAETMNANKMSREAVVARLRAEGRMD